MTDGTLRRLMNSGKGRDLGRALLYTKLASYAASVGIDDLKGNITEDDVRERMFALDRHETAEFLKISRISDTIYSHRETAMSHVQHAARRCEYLTGRLVSAWLFEQLQDVSMQAYPFSDKPTEPGYYSIWNYSRESPYRSDLREDAEFAFINMVVSLRTVKAFNAFVDVVSTVYRIPEAPSYWREYDITEELDEQYTTAKSTLINYFKSKDADPEVYEIIEKNFPQFVPDDIAITDLQKKRAISALKEQHENALEKTLEVLYGQ